MRLIGCELGKYLRRIMFNIAAPNAIYGIAVAGSNEMNSGKAMTSKMMLMELSQNTFEVKTDFVCIFFD